MRDNKTIGLLAGLAFIIIGAFMLWKGLDPDFDFAQFLVGIVLAVIGAFISVASVRGK